MLEILLSISNLILIISILFYFFHKEVQQGSIFKEELSSLEQFYANINEGKDSLVNELSSSKDKLISQSLSAFLKHIEKLETSVLPKPINKKMVEDILAQTPPMVENEIEKTQEQVNQDNFMEVLANVPITADTKIAFEDEINEIENGVTPPELVN